MKERFRKEDIFVVDVFESDTFIIFLSAPRKEQTQLLDHLENLAERVRLTIKKTLFELLYPLLKENIQPKIGYALIIRNPMIKNIRLIINQQVTTLFQPIVNLNTLDSIGYEALSRGPENTEYVSPLILFVIAEQSGLSFELDRLCRKKAFESIIVVNPGSHPGSRATSMGLFTYSRMNLSAKGLVERRFAACIQVPNVYPGEELIFLPVFQEQASLLKDNSFSYLQKQRFFHVGGDF
jgi:hypothetical protein